MLPRLVLGNLDFSVCTLLVNKDILTKMYMCTDN